MILFSEGALWHVLNDIYRTITKNALIRVRVMFCYFRVSA